MTEQNKTGGDASQGSTPWWVNQASEIEAPRGPMPAQQGTATGTPKAPAAESPPKEEAPPTQEAPTQDTKQPEAPAETPAAEAPAAETPEPEAPAAETAQPEAEEPAETPQEPVAEKPAPEPQESPGQHGDEALESLEGPIGEIKEAVAELSELASTVSLTDTEGSDRAPTLGGSASALPISSILEVLSANRKSGTLSVTSRGEHFTLEILEGDVVHASSDRSTREQLLGSILVARDKIDAEQLEDFYKRYTQSSEGDGAEHETLVSREDLMSALEEQVQELFNRLYSAGEGTFSFFEGESSNVEQRIRMNVTKLLLESARTKDEAERKPDAG